MLIPTLFLSFCIPAGALDHPTPPPLSAAAPAENGRVMTDSDSEREEEAEDPPPGKAGGKRHGLGRLLSVDIKERRVVIEHEEGDEEAYQVPEAARLTFAADARPLKLDQLRKGDEVAYFVEGPKVSKLHLNICDCAEDNDDAYARPRPKRGHKSRRLAPRPDIEEEPQFPVDEPDKPMYQSEPAEPPAKAAPHKK